MNLINEFEPIRAWAKERGIFQKGNIKTQTLKTVEEVGELAKAVIENDKTQDKEHEIWDAIGDIIVTLVSVAEFSGMPIEQCINKAYDIISKRTGAMNSEGSWVRDK